MERRASMTGMYLNGAEPALSRLRRHGGAHRRAGTALRCLVLVAVLLTFVLSHGDSALAAAPQSDIYFVHLGDIWKYDGMTDTASLVVPGEGYSLGQPAWSLDGRGLAWLVDAYNYGWLKYVETATLPGGVSQEHGWGNVSHVAVSPDGSKLLDQAWENATLSLFDAATYTGSHFSPGTGGTWAPDGIRVAYNPYLGPILGSNSGFWVHNTMTGQKQQIPVTFPGEATADSTVWGPQWSPDGSRVAIAKYVSATHRMRLVTVHPTGGNLKDLLDLSAYDHYDYRWMYRPGQPDALFVELVPKGSGRPDIFEVVEHPSGPPSLVPRLMGSSFGWEASIPWDGGFSDVDTSHPYLHAILAMRAAGMVDGYGGNLFKPDSSVLRAQFAKMIDGALYMAVNEGIPLPPFTDLGPDDPTSTYPHEFIAVAYNTGITKGTTATTYGPYKEITRAQVITMIVRAADQFIAGGLDTPPGSFVGLLGGFTDPTHGANVRRAEFNDLLVGIKLDGWDLWQPATRGEVAQMLYNFMNRRAPVVQFILLGAGT